MAEREVLVQTRIRESLHSKLVQFAAVKQMSIAQAVRTALCAYLEEQSGASPMTNALANLRDEVKQVEVELSAQQDRQNALELRLVKVEKDASLNEMYARSGK